MLDFWSLFFAKIFLDINLLVVIFFDGMFFCSEVSGKSFKKFWSGYFRFWRNEVKLQ